MALSSLTTGLAASTLFDVKDKVVLISGGSSGIGKMQAATFVANGAKVYIASRKRKQLDEAVKEIESYSKGSGGSCHAFVADLKDRAGCDALAKQLKDKESKLHVLVNNTGMAWGGPLEDFPEENGWDKLMGTNVKSIFYLTTALLPLLTKNADNINPGRVINITSIAGIAPNAENGLSAKGSGTYSYATSKAAANHLTRVLAASLAHRHVTVNAIAPGVYPSKMTAYGISNPEGHEAMLRDQPTGRLGMPEDIGGLALFLASRAASHITGVIIATDGGASLGVQPEKPKAKL